MKKIILLLNDKRNDFYIHIDKKCTSFKYHEFKSLPKFSNIFFTDRISVSWGGFSQIECELLLLKQATKKKYDYYHLLSGADMPLKTADEIHAFFDAHSGKEFVHFVCNNINNNRQVLSRVSLYHFLQKHTRQNKAANLMERVLLKTQKLLTIDRTRKYHIDLFGFGANWFSITHELACYILSKEIEIKTVFRYTTCCDEIFLQTLILNSPFQDRLYYKKFDNNYIACLRYIDWKRGTPYVFRSEDFKELMDSPYLFARKFDLDIDKNIVEKIFLELSNKNSTD